MINIILIHVDETLVLVVAILFLLKYIDICYIHPVVLTLVSVLIWFIGTPLRGISFSSENFGILLPFMLLRTIVLFALIFIKSLFFILFISVNISGFFNSPDSFIIINTYNKARKIVYIIFIFCINFFQQFINSIKKHYFI